MWSRCFFPESELAPFFYDVDGDVRAGTVIVESVVNPPDAEILLASVRAKIPLGFNLTERFAIEAWPSGRFALIYVSPLTLFGVDSMQVFVTVVCNGEAFPLFSLIIRTKVITSPQFYNEPYHLEVNEKLSVGEILNTPLVVIDWDSEFIPPKMYIEDTNSPFEVVVEKHSQISAPVRKITANQTLSRRPTLVRLKLIKPIKHLPINLKLIAKAENSDKRISSTTIHIKSVKRTMRRHPKAHSTKIQKSMTAPVALQELVERNPESISQQLLKNWKTSSSERDSGIASFEQFPMEALRNSVTKESPPRFEHCSITVEMPENSAIGSYVTTLSVLDRKKWTKIDILNPDGTFEIHQDSGNVYIRDNRFIDRELLANLELVAKIRGSSHRTKCSRTHVTVVLLDENDNRPTFEKDKYVFVLSDKFLANAVVGTVRAIDIDEGEGGRVSYRFVNDSSLFIIRRRGQYGEIVTNSSLDGVKDFVLILEACDNAPPFWCSQIPVYFKISSSALSSTKNKSTKPTAILGSASPLVVSAINYTAPEATAEALTSTSNVLTTTIPKETWTETTRSGAEAGRTHSASSSSPAITSDELIQTSLLNDKSHADANKNTSTMASSKDLNEQHSSTREYGEDNE
ncbi:hypothetical protein Angca_002371, partial [Angiostrongylus cantonensis]